jgi:transcriptional regulator with XRE-family HTH domain
MSQNRQLLSGAGTHLETGPVWFDPTAEIDSFFAATWLAGSRMILRAGRARLPTRGGQHMNHHSIEVSGMKDAPETAMEGSAEDMNDTIGGRITRARTAQGLTTAQLARRLGLKTITLSHWETDRAEPRPNRLMMLAGVLGVSPTWLLTGQGTAPSESGDDTSTRLLKQELTRLRDDATSLVERLERTIARL